jgi:hypothetical protein
MKWMPMVLSTGINRPGREADNMPQFIADAKNGGAMPPFSHVSLWHGVYLIKHRDNFTEYTTGRKEEDLSLSIRT